MHRLPLASLFLVSALAPSLVAQNLGGGAKAPNGKVVKFDLESWVPGTATRFLFSDQPTTTSRYILAVSTASTSVTIPGFHGTLRADIFGGKGLFLYGGATTPITLPANLKGVAAVIQGCVIDKNGQGYFTDATKIDFFKPTVLVGCSRQSANSILSIDLQTRKQIQRISNSELGNITFSVDRQWAYVTEPGSRRNYVTAYDMSGTTIVKKATIPVGGGIRYRCAQPRSGKVLYVPIHNGVAVLDTDPKSTTFHKLLRIMKVPIVGNSGTIFTGPMSVQLDITETKLYIAYGERLTYPAKSTVGVIDLKKPGYPHRAIKVTTGGSFIGLATRMDLVRSVDGVHMFVLEWGVQPISPTFVLGFKNGGMLNIVNTLTDSEVKAIPTNGYAAQELTADRLGRNVWIPQISKTNKGQVLRVDVDATSSNRFSIKSTILVSATTYNTSSGPKGIACTPDSSTVCITMSDGTGQRYPELWTMNARTEKIFGTPIRVESLPGTVSITQF